MNANDTSENYAALHKPLAPLAIFYLSHDVRARAYVLDMDIRRDIGLELE
jgi:hypothetical protein